MVKFLEKCISLRHLFFRECSVSFNDIFELRKAAISQLTSIIVTGGSHQFLQSSLLGFVNKTSSSLVDLDGEFVHSIPRECTIHTEPLTRYDDLTFTGSDDLNSTGSGDKDDNHWSWGRYGPEREIYYWPVDNANEAQSETTIRHFKRRNGQIWYGDGDPLEYLSDWDSEAGDEATQAPGGKEFVEFCKSNPTNSGALPAPKAYLYGLMTKVPV